MKWDVDTRNKTGLPQVPMGDKNTIVPIKVQPVAER